MPPGGTTIPSAPALTPPAMTGSGRYRRATSMRTGLGSPRTPRGPVTPRRSIRWARVCPDIGRHSSRPGRSRRLGRQGRRRPCPAFSAPAPRAGLATRARAATLARRVRPRQASRATARARPRPTVRSQPVRSQPGRSQPGRLLRRRRWPRGRASPGPPPGLPLNRGRPSPAGPSEPISPLPSPLVPLPSPLVPPPSPLVPPPSQFGRPPTRWRLPPRPSPPGSSLQRLTQRHPGHSPWSPPPKATRSGRWSPTWPLPASASSRR